MTKGRVLYVVVCAAPAASEVGDFVRLAQSAGWRVYVITTPLGRRFVDVDTLVALTSEPLRSLRTKITTRFRRRRPRPAQPSKPDPRGAASPAEFVQTMAAYRVWSGAPSYRNMATAIDHQYVPSTPSGIGKRTTLPTLELVTAYIEACGGSPEDLETWREAWRRLALTQPRARNRTREST